MKRSLPLPPSRRSAVDAFRALDVLSQANRMIAAGDPVISLAVGQPSAPAPKRAMDAARAVLEAGPIGYTDALGRAELRAALSRSYQTRYDRSVDPARIMITTGSSAGFNLAFLAAFDHGDRVAIASPGYPAYRNILRALGLVPVEIEVDATSGYLLTADHLASVHARTPLQGVLIASPANPTGTVTPRAELQRLVEFADREGLHFISDEIYHGLVYGEPATTALEFSANPIIVNSFSKYYCMTGWRVGWLVLPDDLVRPFERLGQSLYISAPDLSQVAALAALDAGRELDLVCEGYRANRDLLTARLPDLGFSDIAPIDGAFYAYAAIPGSEKSASNFAKTILEKCHVAITPGLDFDTRRGDRFVRLSYAGSHEGLCEALDRIAVHLT